MAKAKALSEILKRLGIGVKAARPSVKATRPALKSKPKISRRTGRKKDTGPTLSKPTAGAGRGKVKADTPSIKSTRPALKAKPKVSRTTGRKKPASTAVTTTKPSAVTKQPGTAIATRPSTSVAKRPSTAVARRQSRTGRSTAVTTPKGAGPDKIVGLSNKGKAALAAGLAAVGTGTYMGMGDDKKSAKAMVMPKSKPAKQGPAKPSKAPKKAAQPSGPSTRGSAKRGATKPISASKGTGFGPKGSIFPGNAEERKALMKMYGGTGAAAAKAAIAGKQGNLAAGKADYEAARIKRLKAASSTGDRKKGGKVVPNKMKGFSKLPEKVQRKMSPTKAAKYKYGGSVGEGCARQVKGFGAARRPKK
jgi:hypothetical protein